MPPPPPQPGPQTMASSTTGHLSGNPDAKEETPFSLAPSIFLPFKGFTPGDAPNLDHTQKLQKILQNLPEQQALVRGNMMVMVEQRVESLKAKAREELDEIEGDYEDDSGDPEERKRVRTELDAMFDRTRMLPKKDAKSEDFEVKPGGFAPYNGNGLFYPAPTNGDVAMGGTETDPKSRTARMVWEGLSRDLQEVVDRAASEMEGYDRHAQETMVPYKQALERRTGRHIPAPVATGIAGSILRNRNEESPIDRDAIRRMSTGMPVVGVPAAPPTRAYEKMDHIARRGSTSK
ncbi:hypothetical protein N431DRAFT_374856 [Stipitochalara longipes BDJ]|nr:hypothetical protein N431DRAFT_374856 [Stipitochalara longipes BDJ]